jgi:hypothetical protein
MNPSTFRVELERIINSNSMENGSNTPDFILAAFLHQCLEAFDAATVERERWYSIKTGPKLGAEGPMP